MKAFTSFKEYLLLYKFAIDSDVPSFLDNWVPEFLTGMFVGDIAICFLHQNTSSKVYNY